MLSRGLPFQRRQHGQERLRGVLPSPIHVLQIGKHQHIPVSALLLEHLLVDVLHAGTSQGLRMHCRVGKVEM